MGNRRRIDRRERIETASSRLRGLGVALVRLLGALAVTAVLVFGVVGLHGWVTTSETFAVRHVEVHHAQLADADELKVKSGVRLGENIFSLDLAQAARAVEQDPWVAKVSVSRDLPDTVHIVLEERRPVALVALESLYVVDASGLLFKRVRAFDQVDLPIITGLAREAFLGDRRQDADLRTALLVVERWQQGPMAMRAELAEVNVGVESGVPAFTAWAGEGPVELRLGAIDPGDVQTLDDAFARLQRVWGELDRRGAQAAMIDLGNRRRPDWVPVRLE